MIFLFTKKKTKTKDGFGQLQYSNNDRYDGEWNEGMRSGKGVHLFENGDKYDGEWANNIQNGEGSYITTTGFIYNGCWLCGRVRYFLFIFLLILNI